MRTIFDIKKIVWILLGVAASVCFENARCDIIKPTLPKGTMELGINYRIINRTLSWRNNFTDLEGSDGSLFIRYGITDLATISMEGLVLNDIKYRFGDNVRGKWNYYVMGTGLQMIAWHKENWSVEPGVHYTYTIWFSDQDDLCDRHIFTLSWVLLARHRMFYGSHEMELWAGPGRFFLDRENQSSAVCTSTTWGADNSWGVTAGANITVFQHYQGYFSLVRTDRFEPRFGLSFRF